jgi:hypothetical protein
VASSMKIKDFWNVALCILAEVDHHGLDYGGSTHLLNVGLLQRDYTALNIRKLSFSSLLFYLEDGKTEKIVLGIK